jgi:hypothetical protein
MRKQLLIALLLLLTMNACTQTKTNVLARLSADIEDIRGIHGLANSTPILKKYMQQAWRETPDAEFEPGYVELHADDDSLLIVAILRDRDIYNDAIGFNEKTWQTGDVFEIFIQTDADTYYEFHITPENRNLFLAWTTESFNNFSKGKSELNDVMINQSDFITSLTQIHKADIYWSVFARIPYINLEIDHRKNLRELKIAFARYDAKKQPPPVLSATPNFLKKNFHLREFWHPFSIR